VRQGGNNVTTASLATTSSISDTVYSYVRRGRTVSFFAVLTVVLPLIVS